MLVRLKGFARLGARLQGRRPRLEILERRDLMASYTVTSAADSGTGSLRAEIALANSDNQNGADSISFDIGTGGPQTIALQSPLPAITRTVVIDGTTEPSSSPSSSSAPRITIDGTNPGAGADGLTLLGPGGSTIRGLAIVNFASSTNDGGRGILVNDAGGDTFRGNYLGIDVDGNTAKANVVGIEIKSSNNFIGTDTAGQASNLISGNLSSGILIDGAGATGNQVLGNQVGTDITGQGSVGNLYGITIASASNNTIGGTSTLASNLISGNVVGSNNNTGVGIVISGTSSNNVIEGNLIGTDSTGKTAVYNIYGIYLGTPGGSTTDSITTTTIGGTASGAGNTISGNGFGIFGNVTSSTIAGNRIGTDITGASAIGNGYGIYLGADGTTIGGTTAAARNIIASSGLIGSGGTGLDLSGDTDNVEGNRFGTNADGTAALPNAVGISLHTTNSTIGGTASGAENLIAGNTGSGIVLDINVGNTIQGNVIGNAAGGSLGNGGNGISVILAVPTGSTATTPLALNDTIGGTATAAANIIAGNVGAGVAVTNTYGAYTGLSIRGNSIVGNGKLGISLGATIGVPTLGNLAITLVSATSSSTTIDGVVGGTPGDTVQIDLYSNAAADASGYGQGQNFLGSVPVTIGPGGLAEFTTTLPTALGSNKVVTATSTPTSTGSTSEFSAAFPNSIASTDLGVTQTVSATSVAIGGTVTFTATVTNNGTTTASNVMFADALQSGLINPTITSTVGTSSIVNSDIAEASLGDLAPGASATVTITVNTSVNGSVSNTVGVLGTTPDTDYSNNSATQTLTVGAATTPSADLAISITPSTTSPVTDSDLTYTVTVTNNGPSDATNATVNDFLPSGAILVSATPSQGAAATIQGTLITDNFGTIASGASATLTITVVPTSTGSIANSANVSGNQRDPVATNNSATSTLTVASGGTAALTLTQTLNPGAGTPGQIQLFTLTIQNTGTGPATGVTLVDSLPAGVTFVYAGPSQGSASTASNGVVTSNLGTIAAGASATLTLVIVPNSYATGLVNFAAVVASGSSATTPVFSEAVLNVPNGPSVASVSGSRSNAQLVVGFNEPITPASATTKANYRLYALGKTPRAITSHDRPIGFTTAVYNSQTNSVTLTPSRSINSKQYYTLVVVGNTSRGITDTSGRKLVGASSGVSGTNYSTTFLAGTLTQV